MQILDTPQETIDKAAILFKGSVFSLDRPARHTDVSRFIMDSLGVDEVLFCTQGFLTSHGRFVRREPAMRIAIKAGQLKAPALNARHLHSEDVW
jgi:hypothetical protein